MTDTTTAAGKAPRDFGREAHDAAEKHLNAIAEAEEYAEYAAEWDLDDDDAAEHADGAPAPEFPDMAGPWCGCQTCTVREVLHAAWDVMMEAAKAELAGTFRAGLEDGLGEIAAGRAA